MLTDTEKAAIEASVKMVYESCNMFNPPQILWTKNPIEFSYVAAVIHSLTTTGGYGFNPNLADRFSSVQPARIRYSVRIQVLRSMKSSITAATADQKLQARKEAAQGLLNAGVASSTISSVDPESVWDSSNYSSSIAFNTRRLVDMMDSDYLCLMSHQYCILCEPPVVKKTDSGDIHAECEPAIYWDGGPEFYFNSGQFLDPELGKILPTEWPAGWFFASPYRFNKSREFKQVFLKTPNAVERIFKLLTDPNVSQYPIPLTSSRFQLKEGWRFRELDSTVLYGVPYKLYQINDGEIGIIKALWMQNPSVKDLQHIEPVPPDGWLDTCEKAMRWRLIGDRARETSQKVETLFIA